MDDIKQWRNLAGALITWTKTGIGRTKLPCGDWNCEGCGTSHSDANACYPEQPAGRCRRVR